MKYVFVIFLSSLSFAFSEKKSSYSSASSDSAYRLTSVSSIAKKLYKVRFKLLAQNKYDDVYTGVYVYLQNDNLASYYQLSIKLPDGNSKTSWMSDIGNQEVVECKGKRYRLILDVKAPTYGYFILEEISN